MAETRASISQVALFCGLVVIGCALDLGSKAWIFGRLGITPPRVAGQQDPIVIVPGIFGLTTNLNPGALFGMGQRFTAAFAVLSVLAALGIAYWLLFAGAGRDRWLTVALACIMSGIFGNLYDRLGLPGLIWPNWPGWQGYKEYGVLPGQPVYAVRDWLHFQIQRIGFDWAIFNIADSLLVVGAIMLFWHVAWREPRLMRSSNSSAKALPSATVE